MELFLNVLWLLMAAGVLWTWRARWIHQRNRTLRHSLQEWTAVSVALILLFFAVSMTDDLHLDVVLFDECSTNRRSSSLSVDSHQPALRLGVTLHGAGPTLVSETLPLRIPRVDHKTVAVSEFSLATFHCQSPSNRAPPLFFL